MHPHQVVKTYAQEILIFRLFIACRENIFFKLIAEFHFLFVKIAKKLSSTSVEFLIFYLIGSVLGLNEGRFASKFAISSRCCMVKPMSSRPSIKRQRV